MTRARVLLVIALMLVAAADLVAQQPPIVNIQIVGNPKMITVNPSVTRVCRNTANCPTQWDFNWVGPGGAEGEKIRVEYLDGLYWDGTTPKQVAATECFIFPPGSNGSSFELEHGANKSKPLVFYATNKACPDKVAFFYVISCVGGEEGNCGGIPELDPATMIDNGRR